MMQYIFSSQEKEMYIQNYFYFSYQEKISLLYSKEEKIYSSINLRTFTYDLDSSFSINI